MNTDTIQLAYDPLLGVLIRLAVEVAALLIIIPGIHRKFLNSREHMFPFFLMGIMIFTICILLKKVELQFGLALGLFAIFSIIRFRTINFSTKDMSYLFAVVGLSAVNAMFDFPHPVRGTIIVNMIVILTILLLELAFRGIEPQAAKKSDKKKEKTDKKDKKEKKEKKKTEDSHILIYDNLGLLNPEKRNDLLKDISLRTGLNVSDAKILKIDLTRNNAELEIFCKESPVKNQEE
jgi:hypothetical protein